MPLQIHDELLGLAPLTFTNYRQRRYLGDDLCLPLAEFTAADQARVRALYEFLQELFALLDRTGEISPEKLPRVFEFIAGQDVKGHLAEAQAFGTDSYRAHPSELLAKTIHDLRGGGLTLLLNRLLFAQKGKLTAETARSLFFLARDHLKIMRNALLGLDDAKREEDLLPKLHALDYIVEKWADSILSTQERQIRLAVDSQFDGNITECCVEFGALDRILYNLINNACRHTAADEICLTILPLPNEQDLRFVLANRVTAEEEARLAGRELRELFQPGVSSTGSGLGLTVAADFVAHAYGLSSRTRALEKAYLGAVLLEHEFTAWFHWPIAPDI